MSVEACQNDMFLAFLYRSGIKAKPNLPLSLTTTELCAAIIDIYPKTGTFTFENHLKTQNCSLIKAD